MGIAVLILSLDIDPDLRGETTGFWSSKAKRLRYFRDWQGQAFEALVYDALRAQWGNPRITEPLDIMLVYYFRARQDTLKRRPFAIYPPTVSDLNSSMLRALERVCVASESQVISVLGRKEWTLKGAKIEVFMNPLVGAGEP